MLCVYPFDGVIQLQGTIDSVGEKWCDIQSPIIGTADGFIMTIPGFWWALRIETMTMNDPSPPNASILGEKTFT